MYMELQLCSVPSASGCSFAVYDSAPDFVPAVWVTALPPVALPMPQ